MILVCAGREVARDLLRSEAWGVALLGPVNHRPAELSFELSLCDYDKNKYPDSHNLITRLPGRDSDDWPIPGCQRH